MFVNKHKFNCCCCLSLNQATIFVGVFYTLIAIGVAIFNFWTLFTYCMGLIVALSAIFFKPSSVQLRKTVFDLSVKWALIGAVTCIVILIRIFAVNKDEHTCRDYVEGDPLTDYSNCWMNIFIYIIVAMIGFIAIPFNLVVIQILYYGWKE